MKAPLAERFWAKVDKGDGSGCWEWRGAKQPNGYGSFAVGHNRVKRAHRVAFELVVGPIHTGLEIDHLCRNPACVRPDHLEPVTKLENITRSAMARHRDVCRNGHRYTDENTYHYGRQRFCRTCNRLSHRRAA